jgi:hypothetical protein
MEQQEVMVDIMKEEWDGILLDRPTDECAPQQRQPRLEEILNKILIKVKRPAAKASLPTGTSLSLYAGAADDDLSGSEDEREGAAKKRSKVPICESLSALSIYTHSEHFKAFELPAARTFSHIFSISETKILELHTTKQREMFSHNRNFFMRAFPNGIRVDSSNLDPSLFWRKGVQMVAMNWQNWDEGMVLNEAMFADSEGWILKPHGYRSGDKGSTTQADALAHRTLDLAITFYAGQHIPLPEARQKGDAAGVAVGAGSGNKRFRPYVKVDLIVEKPEERAGKPIEGGARAREGQYKMKTETAETDHPDWGKNGDCLNFSGVKMVVEELSFVRLVDTFLHSLSMLRLSSLSPSDASPLQHSLSHLHHHYPLTYAASSLFSHTSAISTYHLLHSGQGFRQTNFTQPSRRIADIGGLQMDSGVCVAENGPVVSRY